LRKVRSDDEKALFAACVYEDLTALGASSGHSINLLTYALRKEVRTAYSVLSAGRTLIAVAIRHVTSTESPAVVQPRSRADKTVRPDLRASCRRSLFNSKARVQALSRLNPRDQILIAREIEQRIRLADMEVCETIEDKAGLHKLSHQMLDDLDVLRPCEPVTRRQLGKRGAAERRQIVAEWISDKLDELTGTQDEPPPETTVREYVAALEAFAKRYRVSEAGKKSVGKRKARGIAAAECV
jgi:hypothetical protein